MRNSTRYTIVLKLHPIQDQKDSLYHLVILNQKSQNGLHLIFPAEHAKIFLHQVGFI